MDDMGLTSCSYHIDVIHKLLIYRVALRLQLYLFASRKRGCNMPSFIFVYSTLKRAEVH